MNEKKKQNQKVGKTVNVTFYDINGTSVNTSQTSFDTRGQILKYIAKRNAPSVAAIMLNNQPVVFKKEVVSKIEIDHEYYLDKNLQTFDKNTHRPTIVPVDVVGRLIGKSK